MLKFLEMYGPEVTHLHAHSNSMPCCCLEVSFLIKTLERKIDSAYSVENQDCILTSAISTSWNMYHV